MWTVIIFCSARNTRRRTQKRKCRISCLAKLEVLCVCQAYAGLNIFYLCLGQLCIEKFVHIRKMHHLSLVTRGLVPHTCGKDPQPSSVQMAKTAVAAADALWFTEVFFFFKQKLMNERY